jgi:hypothetical protein
MLSSEGTRFDKVWSTTGYKTFRLTIYNWGAYDVLTLGMFIVAGKENAWNFLVTIENGPSIHFEIEKGPMDTTLMAEKVFKMLKVIKDGQWVFQN